MIVLSVNSGFDNFTDPDLIDCYIYQVNAILKRYKFLLEKINLQEQTDLFLDKDQSGQVRL